MPVRRIFAPRSAEDRFGGLTECRRGVSWEWGSTTLEFLHPANPVGWSDNNSSCVVLVTHGNSKMLLPGDIEAAVEALLSRRQSLQNLDLLLAPHHGSDTSSGNQFTLATTPDYVIYSVGYANRWGFPHVSVTESWTRAGACGLSTADGGALTFIVTEEDGVSQVIPERARWRRPWPLRAPVSTACVTTTAL